MEGVYYIDKERNEFSKLLDKYVGVDIKPYKLQVCNTNYINDIYEFGGRNILYKEKERNIYYFMKEMRHIEYNMAFIMLCYTSRIMDIEMKKNKYKHGHCPLVIPIVLYTGEEEWTAKIKLSELQGLNEKEKKYTELQYILIEMKNYNIEKIKSKEKENAIKLVLKNSKVS